MAFLHNIEGDGMGYLPEKPSRVRELAVTYLAYTAAVEAIVNFGRATRRNDTLSERLMDVTDKIDAKRDRLIRKLATAEPKDADDIRLRKEALLDYCAKEDEPVLVQIALKDSERLLAIDELRLGTRQS